MLLDDRLNWRLLRQEEPEIGADDAAAEVAGESTETANTEAVETPEPEADDSVEQSLSDILRERELGDFAGDDDDATLDRISEQLKQSRQYQQQIAQYQQQAQYAQWQQYQAYQQAEQARQAAQQYRPQQGPQFHGVLSHWQQVPEYNDQWLQFLDQDEHGNPVVKPGGDPTLPQKIAAYKEWQRQGLNTMLSNPTQFVADAIYSNPEISAAFSSMIEQRIAPIIQQMEARNVVEQAQRDLFEYDETGRMKRDASGNAVMTPVGRHYAPYAQRLEQMGIPFQQAHGMAMEFAQLQAAKEAPSEASASPSEKRQARNFRIMRNAANKTRPNRGTSSASNKRPSESGLQQVRQAFAHLDDKDITF
jgi:hypothetical protein